ncbi:MAG: DUF1990 domain-containing protein [Actinomycetota bacterium]|nr:DUF1990 domain-containing protein [Actinomycetota bacterium]
MPRPPTLPRGLLVAARWPVGIVVTGWAYLWRTTPMHRGERDGAWPQDGPPEVSTRVRLDGVQRPEDGAGPLFRRRYRARVRQAGWSAAELMRQIQADPDRVAPGALAHFDKTVGEDGVMRVGDEYVVRMPGPWNGPIRVVEVTDTSFRFVTLDGHLEAGQIEWRTADDDGRLVFEIESWARSGDRLSYIAHDRLRMAKEVQLHMWTSVLERVARLSGGRLEKGIDIETRRAEVSG